MTIQGEADLDQKVLAPVIGETGNAGDQGLRRGKERLLEGCAWVG